MSTHHQNYLNYSQHRVGSSMRRTLYGNYKKDKKKSQPYSDHQAPNINNQMAVNLSLSVHNSEIHPKHGGHQIHQGFHLHTPASLSKPRLKQSVSLPAFSSSQSSYSHSQVRPHVNYANRPLPSLPDVNVRMPISCKRTLKRKSSEGGQARWRKNPLRRQTVHHVQSWSNQYRDMSSLGFVRRSAEDHIYEEIAEVDSESDNSEKENEEMSFISLISIERRKNLRFYGSTGWDFGTEVI
eukprot:TRINITY_DN13065_c0_g1_i3.p1 TRINITY_DN13065_c0_g1~~TRINITY_DN13065_c0_g1_i3.p1  ORF type:complete len:239 (+),score=50.25 TRINITY_DN13065_c0_g1_i3:246-962(+)